MMKDPGLHRILFVEDDPDIQMVGKMALEAIGGFTVLVCNSGIEALARLEEFDPDLVLLDVMMPGMDGPATLEALREREMGRNLPVVYRWAYDFSVPGVARAENWTVVPTISLTATPSGRWPRRRLGFIAAAKRRSRSFRKRD